MSGGSWDYEYNRFEDVAKRLLREPQAERKALGKKIMLIATALHDIEWVDSDDYSPGDDLKAIDKALGKEHRALKMEILIEQSRDLIKQMTELAK